MSKVWIWLGAILNFCYLSYDFCDDKLVLFPVGNSGITNTCMLIGSVVLYKKISEYWPKIKSKWMYVFSLMVSTLFSFLSIMGKYFHSECHAGIADIFTNSMTDFLKAGIIFIGGCFFFFSIIMGVGAIRMWNDRNKDAFLAESKLFRLIDGRYSLVKIMLCIGLCWIPHLIIRYPGAMVNDMWGCLRQYLGYEPYTTQHPIVYTLLFGKLYDLGKYLGNYNYGLFLLIMIQVLVMLFAAAYTVKTLKDFRVPKWVISGTVVLFSIFPPMIATATTAMIDALFGAAMLILANELAYYLYSSEIYEKSLKHIVLTVAAIFLTFVRYNGIYILFIVFLLLLVKEGYFLFKKKQRISHTIIIMMVILLPLLGGKMGTKMLNQQYNATSVSGRVLYAVPMQQVARCMVYHEEYFDDEVMTEVNKIMTKEVSYYQERYYEYSFDTIKFSFNYEATGKDKLDFIKAWMKMVVKFPGTCVSATINQTYFMYSPTIDNQKYYKDATVYQKSSEADFTGKYKLNPKFDRMRSQLRKYYFAFGEIPFVGELVNQGFHCILLLAVCFYALFEKNINMLFFNVPSLLTIVIAIVGPDMQGHPRYTYPVMYIFPLMMGLYLMEKSKKEAIGLKELEGECDE